MPVDTTGGQVDLENELTCSICTGILFQPLTLLDCLHTFCGACLKEWFGFQATNATSLHPYTCPSCRSQVRATRPNASYNTLLDMFLQMHPGRGKSTEEKEEDRRKYKSGDNVLPKLRRRRSVSQLWEDRQSVSHAGGSVQTVQVPDSTLLRSREEQTRSVSQHTGVPGRPHDISNDTRQTHGHPRAHDEGEIGAVASGQNSILPTWPRASPVRHVEHQASIRSLLSEVDSEEMATRIGRQIAEEGLLEGIDFDALDLDQEDALSERIAQAYLGRLAEQRRERSLGSTTATRNVPSGSVVRSARSTASAPPHAADSRGREQSPHAALQQAAGTGRPPVSRPHLFQAINQNQHHHRRSSSQDSSVPRVRSRSASQSASPTAIRQEVAGTTSSMIIPPLPRDQQSRSQRPNHDQRRATDPERIRIQNDPQVASDQHTPALSPSPQSLPATGEDRSAAQVAAVDHTMSPSTRAQSATFPITHRGRPLNQVAQSSVANSTTAPTQRARSRPSSSTSHTPRFVEPSVFCNRCAKRNIQYSLHYNCHRCENGAFNLCSSCYRAGKGCLHWFGFGSHAQQRFEASAPPEGYAPNQQQPHTLTGRRYLQPKNGPQLPWTSTPEASPTTPEDPGKRLQSGVFCAVCSEFSNVCYWKCNFCNEGEWGYCNRCVNRGRHCTHALLPLTHKRGTARASGPLDSASSVVTHSLDLASSPPSSPALTPKAASIVRGPGIITIANSVFVPLTFSTLCDICRYPIPPSRTRFHCPQCNDGDYDICTSCYTSAVARSAISVENGHQGWRRCPKGHRMVVVGFEDRDGGQRRIVVDDLVGGYALNEEEAFASQGQHPALADGPPKTWRWKETDGSVGKTRANHLRSLLQAQDGDPVVRKNFPPNGGEGFHAVAKWSYFPADASSDDLTFPKNAEIREATDINGDWFWGVYCGAKGLFPEVYVQITGP